MPIIRAGRQGWQVLGDDGAECGHFTDLPSAVDHARHLGDAPIQVIEANGVTWPIDEHAFRFRRTTGEGNVGGTTEVSADQQQSRPQRRSRKTLRERLREAELGRVTGLASAAVGLITLGLQAWLIDEVRSLEVFGLATTFVATAPLAVVATYLAVRVRTKTMTFEGGEIYWLSVLILAAGYLGSFLGILPNDLDVYAALREECDVSKYIVDAACLARQDDIHNAPFPVRLFAGAVGLLILYWRLFGWQQVLASLVVGIWLSEVFYRLFFRRSSA